MLGDGSGDAIELTPWLSRSDSMQVPTGFDVAWDEDAPEHVVLLDGHGKGIELELAPEASTRLRWAVMADQSGEA